MEVSKDWRIEGDLYQVISENAAQYNDSHLEFAAGLWPPACISSEMIDKTTAVYTTVSSNGSHF